ncbi:hypothetical protein GYMLUDRAFT_218022 [Collybiopsis luxurians FD-317 M1]|nr:hypothetical protein GYMLUDRAFT_218022 [Collybiopsis luxurians FD-317 M1]
MYGVYGSTARSSRLASRTLRPGTTVDSKSTFSCSAAAQKKHKGTTTVNGLPIPDQKKPLPSRPAPSNEQFELFTNHVESLLKKNASPPPGWKHSPTSNGEFKRLASKIPSVKGFRANSLDKTAFVHAGERLKDNTLPGTGDIVSETSSLVLEPGTFVEIRRSSTSTNAVILGYDYIDRQKAFNSLSSTGEVWSHTSDDVLFDIPNFTSYDLAARCGSGPIASSKAELAARVEVLKKLRVIQKDCEDAINIIASRGLDVYETVRAKDDETKWGQVSIAEVARLLLPNRQPTVAHVFAAHKFLVSNSLHFVVSHDYNTSRKFEVRPLADVKRFELISKWTKGADEEGKLQAFIRKAKDLIKQNPSQTRIGPPTKAIVPAHTWSPSDISIITFLLQFLRPQYRSQQDPFLPVVQEIVKQIYEEGDVFDETVHRLLLDIGAVAPWQNVTELRDDLDLDLDGRQESEGIAIVERSFRYYKSNSITQAPAGQILGPEDFYPTDQAEAIRHDFGDMPVYVIDDIGAKELDDGLSVESLPNEPDRAWVHVHVADPTSLLPPTHLLSKQAEARVQSVYFYQRTLSMLPKSFTHHPTHGFSLGCQADDQPGSGTGKSQPTLTFSVKVDLTSGTILDYLIRPGVVRNIVITSYEAVDGALGITPDRYEYPFGRRPAPHTFPEFSERSIRDIELLYKTALAFVARRYRDNVFILSRAEAGLYDIKWPEFDSPIVWARSFPSYSGSSLSSDASAVDKVPVSSYGGFPSMSYRVLTHDTNDLGSRSLVAEMMKLASRAASMFARDRDIPVIRRWATPPVIQSEQALADILDARTSNGYIAPGDAALMKYVVGDSVAGYSTDLKEHWGLGIPAEEGYAKGTSPLRRFGDMVVHWQIKHALVHEHVSRSSTSSGGPSVIGVDGGKKVLFSREWLDDFAIRNGAAERMGKRVQGQYSAWWNVAWLMRRFEACGFEGFKSTSTSFELANPASGSSLSSSSSSNSDSDSGAFRKLVATTRTYPEINRDSRKWQTTVSLDSLGLRAVLLDDPVRPVVEGLTVGDRVEVEVSAMRLGIRPQVQVMPRRR